MNSKMKDGTENLELSAKISLFAKWSGPNGMWSENCWNLSGFDCGCNYNNGQVQSNSKYDTILHKNH